MVGGREGMEGPLQEEEARMIERVSGVTEVAVSLGEGVRRG